MQQIHNKITTKMQQNKYLKLSKDTKIDTSILKTWLKAKDKSRIAQKFKVSRSYVNYIINNKRSNADILIECIRVAEKNKKKSILLKQKINML